MSTTETVLVIAVWVAVAVFVALRLGPILRRHQPAAVPPYANFTPPPAGARYLACDTTICGHLAIVHAPQPDGTWKCTRCGHIKGGQ
ncbi:hypothetical protein [Streptomyces lydicamycinicus]|uniref:hypothetical protein n=1 Tax=Streptomyces lydicamycinicus TaxID=1546107 RepID=UPI003C2C53FF